MHCNVLMTPCTAQKFITQGRFSLQIQFSCFIKENVSFILHFSEKTIKQKKKTMYKSFAYVAEVVVMWVIWHLYCSVHLNHSSVDQPRPYSSVSHQAFSTAPHAPAPSSSLFAVLLCRTQ